MDSQIQLPRSVGLGVVVILGAYLMGGIWYASQSVFKIAEMERRFSVFEPSAQLCDRNATEISNLLKYEQQQDKRLDSLYGQFSLLDAHGSRGLDRVEARQKDLIDEMRALQARLEKLDEQVRRLNIPKVEH